MNKRIITLTLIFFVIVAVAIVIFTLVNRKNAVTPPNTNQPIVNTPGFDSITPPAVTPPTVVEKNGEVPINEIEKNKLAELSEGGINFKDNSQYYMAYYPQQQGFIITILDPNIETARKQAEEEFIRTLKITKEHACSLNVSLTVPLDVNEAAAGGNYRLSFCPDGKPFPSTK